jgi:hypothetical protein
MTCRVGEHQGCIGMRGERLQQQALIAIEALARPLAGCPMDPHVGDVVEPLPSLLIEIGVIEKPPAVDEIVAQIAHRTLDFAFGLRAA